MCSGISRAKNLGVIKLDRRRCVEVYVGHLSLRYATTTNEVVQATILRRALSGSDIAKRPRSEPQDGSRHYHRRAPVRHSRLANAISRRVAECGSQMLAVLFWKVAALNGL